MENFYLGRDRRNGPTWRRLVVERSRCDKFVSGSDNPSKLVRKPTIRRGLSDYPTSLLPPRNSAEESFKAGDVRGWLSSPPCAPSWSVGWLNGELKTWNHSNGGGGGKRISIERRRASWKMQKKGEGDGRMEKRVGWWRKRNGEREGGRKNATASLGWPLKMQMFAFSSSCRRVWQEYAIISAGTVYGGACWAFIIPVDFHGASIQTPSPARFKLSRLLAHRHETRA